MEALNARNMSLTYGGGVGTGGTAVPPVPNLPSLQMQTTAQHPQTYRHQQMHGGMGGQQCSNSRGYAYQDMHVHQLHVEVITLSQFHICMSHV